MSLSRWLAVLLRIVVEAVVLGFAWRRTDWSVAVCLTALTANMEWDAFMRHLNRVEDEALTEKGKLLQRINSLR